MNQHTQQGSETVVHTAVMLQATHTAPATCSHDIRCLSFDLQVWIPGCTHARTHTNTPRLVQAPQTNNCTCILPTVHCHLRTAAALCQAPRISCLANALCKPVAGVRQQHMSKLQGFWYCEQSRSRGRHDRQPHKPTNRRGTSQSRT